MMAYLEVPNALGSANWKASCSTRILQHREQKSLGQRARTISPRQSPRVWSQRCLHSPSHSQLRRGIDARQKWRSCAFAQPGGFEQPSGNSAMNREFRTFSKNNNSDDIPLWLWFCRSLYNSVKDALQFLREQPRQLQYIEWPSLQSTVRMAILTVIVVAFLIVFLATMDSTFSYVLSSILRRVPK